MKARKLRVESKPGKAIPQFKLIPHPPDKVKPVIADHSLPSSRDSSAQRPENTPTRSSAKSVNPSPPNPAHIFSTRPEDLISQYATPPFVMQRGRKWNPSNVQPRQKPARAVTVDAVPPEPTPPKDAAELSALSSLATEMKKMFECMPQLMTAHRDRRKMSRSVQYDNPPDLNSSIRARLMKKRLSSHNVHAEAASVYQNVSFDTPSSISHRSGRRPRSRKGDSLPPGKGRTGSTTVRSRSSEASNLPHLAEKPAHLENLQKYFLEFHQKSRDLLGKLERSVLGDKHVSE